jgi:spiro-SPASM protein
MNALTVLFGGSLSSHAFEPFFAGKNAVELALERGSRFPGTSKIVLLVTDEFEGGPEAGLPGFELVRAPEWTKRSFLERVSALSAGFDLTYVAWADCPFLDPALAGAIAERHLRYAAEYSYADGWPYGFAPEVLSPGTAGILSKILDSETKDEVVERDLLFSVIQKDINSFDIETEISPEDLRSQRLSLSAGSKRDLLLLGRFVEAAGNRIPKAAGAAALIRENPEILRTLPAFYPVQVSGVCPQSCVFCPYGRPGNLGALPALGDFMKPELFFDLLEKISAFSGDAVIDLSLWGELALHPQKEELIAMVLSRPEFALVIETSGIGWRPAELENIAAMSAGVSAGASALAGAKRRHPLPPLSWIVSLDSADPQRYREIRGPGFPEATDCAKRLFELFPADTYVQAIRVAGAEDDTEKFYRSWKEAAPRGISNIIIQKYDDFCGVLPKRQASDLSPVERQPCWHLMRDMPVLVDGSVPVCREVLFGPNPEIAGFRLGNVHSGSLEEIWSRGQSLYREHCLGNYAGPCAECDEYYTYNF